MAQVEQGRYLVRLTMIVDANVDDPGDAAAAFVDKLSERGSRDWVYVVCDPDTNEVKGYFDGYGLPLQVGDTETGSVPLQAVPDDAVPGVTGIRSVEDTDLPDPTEGGGEEDALLAVARQANAERT